MLQLYLILKLYVYCCPFREQQWTCLEALTCDCQTDMIVGIIADLYETTVKENSYTFSALWKMSFLPQMSNILMSMTLMRKYLAVYSCL